MDYGHSLAHPKEIAKMNEIYPSHDESRTVEVVQTTTGLSDDSKPENRKKTSERNLLNPKGGLYLSGFASWMFFEILRNK